MGNWECQIEWVIKYLGALQIIRDTFWDFSEKTTHMNHRDKHQSKRHQTYTSKFVFPVYVTNSTNSGNKTLQ